MSTLGSDRLDMRVSKLFDGLTARLGAIARTIEDSAGRRDGPPLTEADRPTRMPPEAFGSTLNAGRFPLSVAGARVPDVEAVAWTAIGLLAVAVFGNMAGLYHLGNRIDAQGATLNARIDELGTRIEAQGAALSARIDALSARMAEHMGRHAG